MYTFDLAYFVSSLSDCEQLFMEKILFKCILLIIEMSFLKCCSFQVLRKLLTYVLPLEAGVRSWQENLGNLDESLKQHCTNKLQLRLWTQCNTWALIYGVVLNVNHYMF